MGLTQINFVRFDMFVDGREINLVNLCMVHKMALTMAEVLIYHSGSMSGKNLKHVGCDVLKNIHDVDVDFICFNDISKIVHNALQGR